VGASEVTLGIVEVGDYVGMEFVDGKADTKQTAKQVPFQNGRWYKLRLRVTQAKIEAWADDTKMIDLPRAGHTFSAHAEYNDVKPFGFLAWAAEAALRNITLTKLGPQAVEEPKPGKAISLFDGKSLDGWRIAEGGCFVDHAGVRVDQGQIILGQGAKGTGIAIDRDFPTSNYEVTWEALRLRGGGDFFSFVFPVGDAPCAFVIGQGNCLGLEAVDGRGPNNDPTMRKMTFQNGRWYKLRLRVTDEKVEVWIDQDKLTDQPLAGHKITMVDAFNSLKPFGFLSWGAEAALRNIVLQRLESKAGEAPR
jgi:hypothetical protein